MFLKSLNFVRLFMPVYAEKRKNYVIYTLGNAKLFNFALPSVYIT